jgi:hypothetical protein
MTEKKESSNSRRKLLKSLATGSGAVIAGKSLPNSWARPVVDSVLLPAHARTSGGPYGGTNNNPLTMIDNNTLFAKTLRVLVGDAHAQPESFDFTYCITPVSATSANTAVLVTPGDSCPYFAQLFTLDNVEINTGPQDMGFGVNQCIQGSAADWLDSMGLIKDAMASAPSTIELTVIEGQATGTFSYQSGFVVDDFTFGTVCPSFVVECCK